MKHEIKREYFSIPNLMGYFRILLIPVYLFLYINADSAAEHYAAIAVIVLSYLTDFLDGKIARRFNMITEFGKILDPVADKLTQGALAISFSFRYPALTILLLFFLIKEIIMLILGLYMLKHHYMMNGAQKHGKIFTAVFDVAMFILLLFPKLPYAYVNLLIFVVILVMLISFFKYLCMYWNVYRAYTNNKKNESVRKMPKCLKILLWILLIIILYLSLVIVPYIKQPDISQKTSSNFNATDYYGENDCLERVKVISDNGKALEDRIRLISSAKEEIILSTFDFDSDTSGTMVLAALLDAAQRGVRVKVIVDGFSYSEGIQCNPWFLALINSDYVEFKVYNPINLLKPWAIMGRLHDKYLIADQKAYILGGRNTYDFFLGDQPGYKNYDWDLLVFNEKRVPSDSMEQLYNYFNSIWNQKDSKTIRSYLIFKKNPAVRKCQDDLKALYQKMQESHSDWFKTKDYYAETLPAAKICLLSNPTTIYPKEPIAFYQMTELMMNSKDSVFFHTPYIICNQWMLHRLQKICEDTPAVYMMTNSLANNGNPFGAMDYSVNKKKLLDTGLHIMEFDGGISYHGKCSTIDQRLSIIGSLNWDMRSVYLDTELMLVVDSESLNKELRKEMEHYENDSLMVEYLSSYSLRDGQSPKAITPKRSLRMKLIRGVGYWARFLM